MPKQIIARGKIIPIEDIPEAIRPDNWFENPDWRYRIDRGDLQPMMETLFSGGSLSEESIKRLAQYIIDYAASVATATYIYSDGKILEYNAECLRRLREIDAKTEEDIHEMINIGMDYALDFF